MNQLIRFLPFRLLYKWQLFLLIHVLYTIQLQAQTYPADYDWTPPANWTIHHDNTTDDNISYPDAQTALFEGGQLGIVDTSQVDAQGQHLILTDVLYLARYKTTVLEFEYEAVISDLAAGQSTNDSLIIVGAYLTATYRDETTNTLWLQEGTFEQRKITLDLSEALAGRDTVVFQVHFYANRSCTMSFGKPVLHIDYDFDNMKNWGINRDADGDGFSSTAGNQYNNYIAVKGSAQRFNQKVEISMSGLDFSKLSASDTYFFDFIYRLKDASSSRSSSGEAQNSDQNLLNLQLVVQTSVEEFIVETIAGNGYGGISEDISNYIAGESDVTISYRVKDINPDDDVIINGPSSSRGAITIEETDEDDGVFQGGCISLNNNTLTYDLVLNALIDGNCPNGLQLPSSDEVLLEISVQTKQNEEVYTTPSAKSLREILGEELDWGGSQLLIVPIPIDYIFDESKQYTIFFNIIIESNVCSPSSSFQKAVSVNCNFIGTLEHQNNNELPIFNTAAHIQVGSNVTTQAPQGPVKILADQKVYFLATNEIYLTEEVYISAESVFTAAIVTPNEENNKSSLSKNDIFSNLLSAQILGEEPLEIRIQPNPFQQEFKISYTLDQAQTVSVKVYNWQGYQTANVLHDTTQAAGYYQYNIKQSDWPNGVYYVTITSGDQQITRKLVKL